MKTKQKNTTGRDLRAASRYLTANRDPLARSRLTEVFLFAERLHMGSASYADCAATRAESYLNNGVGKPVRRA